MGEASFGGLHHQFEFARLADVATRLAKLYGWSWLPAGPNPGAAADKQREKQQEEEESDECAHLVMIPPVITFLGSPHRRRYRLGVRTRGSQPRDRGSNPRTGTNSKPQAQCATPNTQRWM